MIYFFLYRRTFFFFYFTRTHCFVLARCIFCTWTYFCACTIYYLYLKYILCTFQIYQFLLFVEQNLFLYFYFCILLEMIHDSCCFQVVKAVVSLKLYLWETLTWLYHEHCHQGVDRCGAHHRAGAAALFLARKTGHWCKHWQVAANTCKGGNIVSCTIAAWYRCSMVPTPWKTGENICISVFKRTISDCEAEFISASIVSQNNLAAVGLNYTQMSGLSPFSHQISLSLYQYAWIIAAIW